ncbi:pre-mRNA-splicing regulator WTAP [Rhinoderma darwinii]|uniref:pre-mRNA-splicing regulator WTAP n=1 Tax=Rhinoderma darwinii TaxID=43563 RepID=UPI003F67A272
MTNEEPLPKKVRLSEADFKVLPREELLQRWKQYEAYVQALEIKYSDLNSKGGSTKYSRAWKFTPDSQTGKKLMAKCRMLIQENQELGRQLSQGRIAQLEAELALQKKYSEELKSSQDELNDFIIQLDEEVEGMQSTILVLQQQLKESRQQLSQLQQQQSQVSANRTPTEPKEEEATSKDCSRVANGPSNGGSSHQRSHSSAALYREGSSAEEDFPGSPVNEEKLSNHSEERTGRGGSSYLTQLSTGYESVDSPTGSENSLTHHSNDTDSNHDSQEEKPRSAKGNRTVSSRHIQNGLDSGASVQGSVL